MPKKISFAVLGMGNRGTRYLAKSCHDMDLFLWLRKLSVRIFGKPEYEIDLEALTDNSSFKGGHEGGDSRMMYDVICLFRGDEFNTGFITSIERSVESHYAAFAAEESRLQKGNPIDMDKFLQG
ncbi:MAG: hypothetical protein PHP79_09000 [Clostridia bacterium]|nr:hypothetical protein [Clostridia bacterium]MDD4680999.1 hypothetical protein [Clostridia bacterium]